MKSFNFLELIKNLLKGDVSSRVLVADIFEQFFLALDFVMISMEEKSMKKILLLMTILTFSLTTYAADSSSGCGPGWYILKKNSLLSSALRSTTNGFSMPTATIGMTFGTSNCTKHSIVKLEKERIKFATENYYEIAGNTSKGQGEYLMAYGELMGCSSQSLPTFAKEMQKNFQSVFPTSSVQPRELVKKTYMMLLQDKKLSQACFQV